MKKMSLDIARKMGPRLTSFDRTRVFAPLRIDPSKSTRDSEQNQTVRSCHGDGNLGPHDKSRSAASSFPFFLLSRLCTITLADYRDEAIEIWRIEHRRQTPTIAVSNFSPKFNPGRIHSPWSLLFLFFRRGLPWKRVKKTVVRCPSKFGRDEGFW